MPEVSRDALCLSSFAVFERYGFEVKKVRRRGRAHCGLRWKDRRQKGDGVGVEFRRLRLESRLDRGLIVVCDAYQCVDSCVS